MRISYIIPIVFITTAALAQKEEIEEFNNILLRTRSAKSRFLEYSEIEGNPYSNKDFIPGTIEFVSGRQIDAIPMRYNWYADDMEFTIMKVGRVTEALFELKKGDLVGVRGPFGKAYPLKTFKGKEIFIVGGGVGFAPLRSLFLALVHNIKDYKKVYIRYGARTPDDLVYRKLIPGWQKIKGVDITLTVDVGDDSWNDTVGVVTVLLDDIPVDLDQAPAFVCGPPLMMKFVTQRLVEAGFKHQNIYLSMEKNMSCGIGKCNHCRVGKFYVCKDGPVLTWHDIKDIEEPFL